MKITLYKQTPNGIRFWEAEADYPMSGILITHGIVGGAIQEQFEDVEENQSGRSLEEQIDFRIESRASKKRDIGYKDSIGEAKLDSSTNTLGFHRPMLARRFDKMTRVKFDGSYLQMKYDGHRCLVTRTSTGLVAYSRNGKRITTIDHILEGIKIPIGVTLDGELYHHGTPLQTITSWVKRKQQSTSKLEYIVYDTIADVDYHDRISMIRSYRLGINARVAPTDKNVEQKHIGMFLDNAISLGYEGLILRQSGYPYEVGKRSAGLIKIKMFLDSEFRVIDILASADGWGVLVCEMRDGGKTFNVSAPGTIRDKMLALRQKDQLIGKWVTVKYANLTNDGIPFHPVAERWREDL